MKTKIVIFVMFIFTMNVLVAQTTEIEKDLLKQDTSKHEGWKKGGMLTLTFSQISLTHWAAGGQNAVSGNGLVNLFANYKMGNQSWDNTLDMGYGMLRQGKGKVKLLKSDDKVELNSKYGHKVSNVWYIAALMNFKTQFSTGYNYPNDSISISDFLAPAYFITALGMDYKPHSSITVFLAPFTGRVIIVNNQRLADAGSYGVDKAVYDAATDDLLTHGKQSKYEFGGYIRTAYTKDLKKEIKLTTKLDLFSN